MKNNIYIDQYIIGALGGKELAAFEEEMLINAELREELAFRRKILAGLKLLQKETLKEAFLDFERSD